MKEDLFHKFVNIGRKITDFNITTDTTGWVEARNECVIVVLCFCFLYVLYVFECLSY